MKFTPKWMAADEPNLHVLLSDQLTVSTVLATVVGHDRRRRRCGSE